MPLDTLRQTIATAIATAIPAIKDARPIAGPASLEEALRRNLRSPSILVRIPAWRITMSQGGTAQAELQVVAALVALSTSAEARDAAVLRLGEALSGYLASGPTFDLDQVKRPTDIAAGARYTIATDRAGLAILEVSWRMMFRIDAGAADELEDFTSIHQEITISSGDPDPEDGPDAVDDTAIPTS